LLQIKSAPAAANLIASAQTLPRKYSLLCCQEQLQLYFVHPQLNFAPFIRILLWPYRHGYRNKAEAQQTLA
jgi:hypothetical protein